LALVALSARATARVTKSAVVTVSSRRSGSFGGW